MFGASHLVFSVVRSLVARRPLSGANGSVVLLFGDFDLLFSVVRSSVAWRPLSGANAGGFVLVYICSGTFIYCFHSCVR